MINQKLLDYIRSELASGIGSYKIKQKLLREGWDEEDIIGAFHLAVPVKPLTTVDGPTPIVAVRVERAPTQVPFVVKIIAAASFVAILLWMFVGATNLILMDAFADHPQNLTGFLIAGGIICLLLNAWCSISLYHGRNWARNVYIFLYTVSSFSSLYVLVSGIHSGTGISYSQIISAVLNIFVAFYMSYQPEVLEAFLP